MAEPLDVVIRRATETDRGVTTELMRAAFAWMRERGVPRVLLWTAAPTLRALRALGGEP